MWFLISAIGLTLTLKFVRHVRDLDRYRYLTLVAALALLVAPLVPHIGTTINGARLWIDFGPFSLRARGVRQDFARLFLRLVLRREP